MQKTSMPYSNRAKNYKLETSKTISHKHKLAIRIKTLFGMTDPFEEKREYSLILSHSWN